VQAKKEDSDLLQLQTGGIYLTVPSNIVETSPIHFPFDHRSFFLKHYLLYLSVYKVWSLTPIRNLDVQTTIKRLRPSQSVGLEVYRAFHTCFHLHIESRFISQYCHV
jgi:hypothetical protein